MGGTGLGRQGHQRHPCSPRPGSPLQGRKAAWRPACSRRETSPGPGPGPAPWASSTSTKCLASVRDGTPPSGGHARHRELPAGTGALRESPWPTGPGRTTRTSRQGLGLGERKGGGLRARGHTRSRPRHTYPNATAGQHHEHPLCQEPCGERSRCVSPICSASGWERGSSEKRARWGGQGGVQVGSRGTKGGMGVSRTLEGQAGRS